MDHIQKNSSDYLNKERSQQKDRAPRQTNLQAPGGFGGSISRRVLWTSMVIGALVLAFSHSVWRWFGGNLPRTPFFRWIGPILATILFVYTGATFLRLALRELRKGKPGVMSLISVAVILTYALNLVLFAQGASTTYFWELAILIDLLLFFYWIGSTGTGPVVGLDSPLEKPGLLYQIAMQISDREQERKDHKKLLDELVVLDKIEHERTGNGHRAAGQPLVEAAQEQPTLEESVLGESKEKTELRDIVADLNEEQPQEEEPQPEQADWSTQLQERAQRQNQEAEEQYQSDPRQVRAEEARNRQELHDTVEHLKTPSKVEPPKRFAKKREED